MLYITASHLCLKNFADIPVLFTRLLMQFKINLPHAAKIKTPSTVSRPESRQLGGGGTFCLKYS